MVLPSSVNFIKLSILFMFLQYATCEKICYCNSYYVSCINQNYDRIICDSNIRILNFSNNSLTNFSVFENISLSSKFELDVSFNQLSNFKLPKSLEQIRTLILNNNNISNLEFLKTGYKKIFSLGLKSNNINGVINLNDFNLDYLKMLNLDTNNIEKFINNNSSLLLLDLTHNKINEIEINKEIKYLYLSHNEITNLHFLKNITNRIDELGLDNNNIEGVINLGDFNLEHLSWLEIQNNNIQKFINIDGPLTSLRLSHNKINEIEINKEIKYLYLSHNEITNLRFLKNKNKIVKLKLNNNNIEGVINLSDLNLEHLHWLELQNNNIQKFINIDGPLRFLNISHNKINEIEINKEIKYLYLSHNEITNLHFFKNKNELIKLKEAHLAHNNITNINSISEYNLNYLHHINLANNQINNITTVIFRNEAYLSYEEYIIDFMHLNLAHNNIDIINKGSMQHARQIYLNNNQITNLELLENLPTLQILDVSHNKITKCNLNQMNLISLQNLNLTHNCISKLELQNLNLKILNVSYNNIQSIANVIMFNLTQLEQIDLSHNQITTIPSGFFDKFPNLKTIDLSNNIIRNIESILDIQKITYINLSNNRLKEIKSWEYYFKAEVDLRGNLLNCDFLYMLYKQNKTNNIKLDINYKANVNAKGTPCDDGIEINVDTDVIQIDARCTVLDNISSINNPDIDKTMTRVSEINTIPSSNNKDVYYYIVGGITILIIITAIGLYVWRRKKQNIPSCTNQIDNNHKLTTLTNERLTIDEDTNHPDYKDEEDIIPIINHNDLNNADDDDNMPEVPQFTEIINIDKDTNRPDYEEDMTPITNHNNLNKADDDDDMPKVPIHGN